MAHIPTPRPKLAKKPKKSAKRTKSSRKVLEKQIEAIVKQIIFYRDGQQCVMRQIDGGRCGNGLMWNHFIAQKQSNWLKLDLGNVHVGCGNHNFLDFRGDKTLSIWFSKTFGHENAERMLQVSREMKGKKRTIAELSELLAHYDELYQNRFTVESDLRSLIKAGWYGKIIQLEKGNK